MQNISRLFPAALALAVLGLGACAADKGQRHGQGGQAAAQQQGGLERFECRNGLVVLVESAGTDRIRLAVENQTKPAVLTIAPSGSGERYVSSAGLYGSGGEWHRKGNEAVFGYDKVHGGTGETVCVRQ